MQTNELQPNSLEQFAKATFILAQITWLCIPAGLAAVSVALPSFVSILAANSPMIGISNIAFHQRIADGFDMFVGKNVTALTGLHLDPTGALVASLLTIAVLIAIWSMSTSIANQYRQQVALRDGRQRSHDRAEQRRLDEHVEGLLPEYN